MGYDVASRRRTALFHGVRAGDLCGLVDLDKPQFKRNVRTRKGLSLTESLGTGYHIDTRCAIVMLIFSLSDATSVHMKDRASGRAGMIPFVNRVLRRVS